MEFVLASILLSLSTNLDNLAVGVAYGLRNLTITFSANLLIAIFSGMSTWIAMSLGVTMGQLLSEQFAASLGSLILFGIGMLGIWETLQSQTERLQISTNEPNSISLDQAALLGLGLTISNLGTGVGAGLAQLDVILTSFLSFISSLMMIGGGYLIGKLFTANFSVDGLGLISGGLLMILGLVNFSTQMI